MKTRSIIWFDDSPDPGKMECICSWCAEVISEEPIRMWNVRGQETRYHATCFDEAYRLKMISTTNG